jgi:hypothetical protein
MDEVLELYQDLHTPVYLDHEEYFVNLLPNLSYCEEYGEPASWWSMGKHNETNCEVMQTPFPISITVFFDGGALQCIDLAQPEPLALRRVVQLVLLFLQAKELKMILIVSPANDAVNSLAEDISKDIIEYQSKNVISEQRYVIRLYSKNSEEQIRLRAAL